jgi:hypothetical protein
MMPARHKYHFLAMSVAVLLLSLVTGTTTTAAVDPAAVQLQTELSALRARVTQLEAAKPTGSTRTAAAPANDLAARVQTLSQQMAALDAVIGVNKHDVTIKAESFTVNASKEITVQSEQWMKIQTVNGRTGVTNALTMNLPYPANDTIVLSSTASGKLTGLKIEGKLGSEDVSLTSSKDISLSASNNLIALAKAEANGGGSTLRLNGCKKPVMTLGSTAGSPTVMAP